MATLVYAPCSNGGARLRSRGGMLVGGGKRMVEAELELVASDLGRTLVADDREQADGADTDGTWVLLALDAGRTLVADDAGTVLPANDLTTTLDAGRGV